MGGFPPLPAHWNLKKSGVPRDVSVDDYICTNHGYNDGPKADRTDTGAKWLADVRKVNTHAAIFLIVPFSGRQRQSITNGAAKYQRANPADKRVFVIDLGDGFYQSVAGPTRTASTRTSHRAEDRPARSPDSFNVSCWPSTKEP